MFIATHVPPLHVCEIEHTLHMPPPRPHDCIELAETSSDTHAPFDLHPPQGGTGGLHDETSTTSNAAPRERTMTTSRPRGVRETATPMNCQ